MTTRVNDRKQAVSKEENATLKETVSVPPAVNPQNLMDDAQLVAVITAAVMAANGSQGGSDKLVVRSIRKAKR